MEDLSLVERAKLYNSTFPKFPPLRADERWLDGIWVMGNNYRGSGYYGSYPPQYLRRVMAFFGEGLIGHIGIYTLHQNFAMI